MWRHLTVFLVSLLLALILPFTAHTAPLSEPEQLANTFSRYDSIGKHVTHPISAPDFMARLIKRTCDNNTDITNCWIEEYPKSQAYIVHITWNKLLPFQKNSCVVVKGGIYGMSIDHTRMNKELKENIKKWSDTEYPPSKMTYEESLEFWKGNK